MLRWAKGAGSLTLCPVRMAPAMLTLTGSRLLAAAFAYATAVALSLPRTRRAYRVPGRAAPSPPAPFLLAQEATRLREGILSNSKSDNIGGLHHS